MLIARVHRLLTAPSTKPNSARLRFWFTLSLALALVYGIIALQQAFRGEYVVDSDARQHVFWMQRFLEPNLFPNDLIADYHESVAPSGYTGLYWLMAHVGIKPLLFNKFLPIVLGLITTGYCFKVCLQILPVPAAGFIATLLLNQTLWMRYDLVSGTARAFIYPLFLAFLYYLLRRSLLPCLGAIALQGLFYPQCVLLSSGILILQIWRWEHGRPILSQNRWDYLLSGAGLVTALLVMLPYALHSSEFGPAIVAAQAKVSPEFLPDGRTPFFHDNSWEFWLYGKRSGILPKALRVSPLIWTGLLLPFLLRNSSHFRLTKQVSHKVTLLSRVVLASFCLFLIAHALLFRLHLPSRYTMHSLLVVLAIAGGITLILILDALFEVAEQSLNSRFRKQRLAIGVTALLGTILIVYPSFVEFPFHKYKQGKEPLLYEFFAQQPQDSLIASLVKEANNLPTFSGRSVLASEMYAIPYHVGYYSKVRQRTNDLIHAQYSSDLTAAQDFIEAYGVDFLLLDRSAFTPESIANNKWLMQFTAATEALRILEQGTIPALSKLMARCSVFESNSLVVLPADCITKAQ